MEGEQGLSVLEICKRGRAAAQRMQTASSELKNAALAEIGKVLESRKGDIEAANAADKSYAEEKKLSNTLQKRLDVTGPKFDQMILNTEGVAKIEDPVGKVKMATELSDGLELYRMTCPIGVICVIFEARPEAGVQISSLCIKSGNALLLKGGKEAANSNEVLVNCVREGLEAVGLPKDAVQLVSTRDQINELLSMDQYVDLIIPRGGNALVKYITDNTRVPVLGHADGICAVYVDKDADVEKACNLVVDSKAQYVSVCNAAETLLVQRSALSTHLAPIVKSLSDAGVSIKADPESLALIDSKNVTAAGAEDFVTEFLDYVIALKVVESVDEAISHINAHGSHHTDLIVTENTSTAERFLAGIDSANVYHNASTRFADGFRYGFGAEVGVSTTRTHSRGPVGVDGLLIYKYRLYGNGHTVGGMAKANTPFTHKPIEPTYRPQRSNEL
ncbi:hypothetical protein NDN08_006772 [Rhodosorus marinus]|uniref:glutamate-5-semialdehyde dehydrogenase n=1 Tax=Rhodosorus marinus TaxID=101924 RepID=A0AAV8UIM1_9RHOD|nr:hypothetical protein NDN08_006772 [Rhodosorus marinus]